LIEQLLSRPIAKIAESFIGNKSKLGVQKPKRKIAKKVTTKQTAQVVVKPTWKQLKAIYALNNGQKYEKPASRDAASKIISELIQKNKAKQNRVDKLVVNTRKEVNVVKPTWKQLKAIYALNNGNKYEKPATREEASLVIQKLIQRREQK